MIKEQFFGKPFWLALLGLAGVFGLAILVFDSELVPIALIALGLVVLALSYQKPELGMAIAFAELFGNSHGHLISHVFYGIPVGLRMTIFLAVMLAWLGRMLMGKSVFSLRDQRLIPFLPLAAAVLLGLVVGFSHDANAAFLDGNAYFYLAYLLPILSIEWTALTRRLLMQVLLAAAVWISALTLGLLFIFSHFPEFMLGDVYRFIRDTRTGELTKMLEGIFRVFIQGQLSAGLALIILSPWLWIKNLGKKDRAVLISVFGLLATSMIISLSRSFWVGFAIMSLFWLALVLYGYKPKKRILLTALVSHALTKVAAVVIILLVLFFPFPRYTGSGIGELSSLFASRSTEFSGDAAIDSRWKLLDPMKELIVQSPLIGHGFGKRVAFITDDPRIRAESPDGHYETYALEWGWLELWLKMGILGPLAFLFLAYHLARGLWPWLEGENQWVGIGFISSILFLFAIHVFSPYLNHPLGLGFFVFVVPFLRKTRVPEKGARISVKDMLEVKSPQRSTAPLTSE